MNPGATIRPVASNTSVSFSLKFAEASAPTFEIRPPSSKISCGPSVRLAGSITRAPLISSIGAFLCRVRRVGRRATDEVIKKRHAYGEAVRHLFEHARLRAVGHVGIDFKAANHRARVKHRGALARKPQAFACELIAQNIFFGG